MYHNQYQPKIHDAQSDFHRQADSQHQHHSSQMTEANVPQASHVRVTSASMSYMQSGHNQHSSAFQQQPETARKMTNLKKVSQGGNTHSNMHIAAVKKQLSSGDIAGFVSQQKQQQMHRVASRQAVNNLKFAASSTSPEPPLFSNNNGAPNSDNQHATKYGQSHHQRTNFINKQQSSAVSQPTFAAHHAVVNSKSPRTQPQVAVSQMSYLGAHGGQNQSAHQVLVQQKRASPPSGVPNNAQQQHQVSSQVVMAGVQSNLVRKQVKLVASQGGVGNAPSNSSSMLNFVRGSTRGSNSPIHHLQGGANITQTKSGTLAGNANQQVAQKIKFLLRGKDGQSNNQESSRPLAMRISKQKSPKFVAEVTSENNTQETFGVVDAHQSKENVQMNFQHGRLAQVQESPSIGEDIATGHPQLHPNISSNNLRGPVNFGRKEGEKQPTFAAKGLKPKGQPTSPTNDQKQQNPPNAGFQTKQFSQNLRYQVTSSQGPTPRAAAGIPSQGATHNPAYSQLSAMVDAQNNNNNGNLRHKHDKSPPVHIHYHNHIQVINSSDLQGSNLVPAATPSKSPKQPQHVPVDSLQKPRISRQPSTTNITAPSRTARDTQQQAPAQNAPKRFTVMKQGSKVPQKIVGSVTPRLIQQSSGQHGQHKSTPYLKISTSGAQVSQKSKLGVQNVSPAGRAALTQIGSQGGPGVKSQADHQFAARLNQKLLDAQQHEPVVTPGVNELKTLTDSVDGSKVTSEALKQLQPIQSVTPSKLSQAQKPHVGASSKKQQTVSVPPLKLNNQEMKTGVEPKRLQSSSKEHMQVHAQVNTGSQQKPAATGINGTNAGRVSHRLKQNRRHPVQQNSSDVNVYGRNTTASQKSSLGNSSKKRQPVLSSSEASSNSLLSLGKNPGANASNPTAASAADKKSANSILINELSKYVNIRAMNGNSQKRFQPLSSRFRKTAQMQSSKKINGQINVAEPADAQGQDQEEIMENLRHFLHFLERKKIINITEVVQDKAKMQSLMQEIMKVDFKDFSKMNATKQMRASSGSESNGSHSRVANTRRRQGTPVNVKQSTPMQQPAAEVGSYQNINNYNHNYAGGDYVADEDQVLQGVTPRLELLAAAAQNRYDIGPASAQCASAEHNIVPDSHQKLAAQQARNRADSNDSSSQYNSTGLVQPNLSQKAANLPGAWQQNNTNNYMSSNGNMSSTGTMPGLMGATAATVQALHQQQVGATAYQSTQGTGYQSTNQSAAMQNTQMLQHTNYLSSNNYVSDSSNGGAKVPSEQVMGQLTKFSNATATSRNKIGHSVGMSGSTSTNTAKAGRSQASHQQIMTSSNEQIGTHVNPHSSNQPTQQQQKYANYKAVAVTKTQRKGNSADPAGNDHSSKKQLGASGFLSLANVVNQRGGDSEGNQAGAHQRRASEGQIIHHHRGRGGASDSSGNKGDGKEHQKQSSRHDKYRYKSRGGSADQGKQKDVLRMSRGSSVKRTAKEIVDYIVIDEERFSVGDSIMKERERLIRFNKLYLKKYRQIPPTTQDYYEFVELIGKGAFGQVTLAIHKLTGRQVAIKAINKSYMQDVYSKQKVMQEVYILKKIRHSNIIRLFEVFQSPKHFLLVMEYADGGDLLQFVKKRQHLDEEAAQRIFKQVVHGIAHCHCRSVLHRDIKLDNILMDHEGSIKICDFGVSRLITKNQSIQEQCGTPAYLAPEIIADKGYRGYYVDLWSLGVLLYAMLQGTVPFKAKSLEALHAIIMTGKLDFPVPISDQALHLIKSLLRFEPEERISIPNVLKHPWLRAIDEFALDDQDDDHDFEMGISFRRQECNFNPLSVMALGDGGVPQSHRGQQQQQSRAMNQENCNEPAEVTVESENLLTEQETNPMHQIGNINVINIENLFHDDIQEGEASGTSEPAQDSAIDAKGNNKLNYDNYCAVTQDFGTHRIDEEALKVLEGFGYPRKLVIDSLHNGELNHATTCYNLLVTQ